MPLPSYQGDDQTDASAGRRIRTVLIAVGALVVLATFVALHLLGVLRPSH